MKHRVLLATALFMFFINKSLATIIPLSATPSPSSSMYCSTEENLLQQFCTPIAFSQGGIHTFLRSTLGHKAYTVEFLPFSLHHLIQFIEFGCGTNQSTLFTESSIRIFLNRVKATPYMSCYALEEFTAYLPPLLKKITLSSPLLAPQMHDSLKNALYDTFIKKFHILKTNVDEFFEEATTSLNKSLAEYHLADEILNQEQLRQMVVRFLEICLMKTVWVPEDQEKVWLITKKIGQNLAVLMHEKIITKDELDDLYHSLLSSFCRFLEIEGLNLLPTTLDFMQKESYDSCLLLSLEEQEAPLQTKRERLQETLLHLKARQLADNQGLRTS